jgi:hypothetical protein
VGTIGGYFTQQHGLQQTCSIVLNKGGLFLWGSIFRDFSWEIF